MSKVGKVVKWDDAKGYGFILPHGGGRQVFFHISSLAAASKRPEGGEVVSFELAEDDRGRPQAHHVAYVGVSTPDPEVYAPVATVPLLAGLIGLVIIVTSLSSTPTLLLLYVALSLMSFTNYSIDKAAANNNHRRTPEQSLIVLDILGGWPGGLIAQQVLRHKTRKSSFQAMFWTSVVVHVLAVAVIASLLR
ncbi:MAG TPA: cold shock and DUF1294 domain-containing protein [Fimbriimonadaceae bacterium]|nr:cold shock and DUF1294 domain-containing protein [Fimbriimonadaceae bacterium]